MSKQAALAAAAAAAADAAAAAAAAAAASSESESEIKAPRSTRRQTRGANVRKSKFITGKTYDNESGSETENTFTEAPTPTSPRKRINSESTMKKASSSAHEGPKKEFKQFANGEIAASLLPVRRDLDDLEPMERRKCPVTDCDSTGHLNGKLGRHFTAEACPTYHNMDKQKCRNFRADVMKKEKKRNKASFEMATKSPSGSPTSDQKRHYNHVSSYFITHLNVVVFVWNLEEVKYEIGFSSLCMNMNELCI